MQRRTALDYDVYIEYSTHSSQHGQQAYALHLNFRTLEKAKRLHSKLQGWGFQVTIQDNRVTILPLLLPYKEVGVTDEGYHSWDHVKVCQTIAIKNVWEKDFAEELSQLITPQIEMKEQPQCLLFKKADLIHPRYSFERRCSAIKAYKTALDIQLVLMTHTAVPDINRLVLQAFIYLTRQIDVNQIRELDERFHLLTQTVPALPQEKELRVALSSIQYSYKDKEYCLHFLCVDKNKRDDLYHLMENECGLFGVYKNPVIPNMISILPGSFSYLREIVHGSRPLTFSSPCTKQKLIDALCLNHLPKHLIIENPEKEADLIFDEACLQELNLPLLLIPTADALLETSSCEADVTLIQQLKTCFLAWAENRINPQEIVDFIQSIINKKSLINLNYFTLMNDMLGKIMGIQAKSNSQYNEVSLTDNPYGKFSHPKSEDTPNPEEPKKGSCLVM